MGALTKNPLTLITLTLGAVLLLAGPLYATTENSASTTATSSVAAQIDEEASSSPVINDARGVMEEKTDEPAASADGLFAGIDPGYTFQRPMGWHVYQIPGMSYERVENMDARLWDSFSKEERDNYFKIEIVVLSQNGLSLREWVAKQNTLYPQPEVLEQEEVEVAGQPALYQLERFGSLIHPVIFIENDNKIYLLNISGTYQKFQTEVDEFIEHFEFKTT